MTNSDTSLVRCDDGTELPVDWAYPGAGQAEWLWNHAHFAQPATPLDRWLKVQGSPGVDRAWAEPKLVAPAMFYRFQFAGPFYYVRTAPYEPARAGEINARLREVARQHGGGLAFWREYCEPRIRRACSELAAADADVPLRWVAEHWAYGLHQTFTSASIVGEAMTRLTTLLARYVPSDAALLAYEVTQGGENASQMVDGEIWELASLARKTPAVSRVLTAASGAEALAALRDSDDAAQFVGAFDDLMRKHGARCQSWEIVTPTWREQPEAPLSLIRAQLGSKGVSPQALTERSEGLRRAATDQALTHLPKEAHAEFAGIVAELDGYVAVREGRAYWQMTIVGEVRSHLIRRGDELVRLGRVNQPDDILFLEPDDIAADASDLRRLVAERRREWEQWCRVTPPEVIGTPGAVAAVIEATVAAAGAGELRGAPASRGTVTGAARILLSPEDVGRLQPGDVLVCVMTTPAWTPLFGVAGGIITETGGMLSHPAITAREYGIPAVLAVQDATTRIRDGQVVTRRRRRGDRFSSRLSDHLP